MKPFYKTVKNSTSVLHHILKKPKESRIRHIINTTSTSTLLMHIYAVSARNQSKQPKLTLATNVIIYRRSTGVVRLSALDWGPFQPRTSMSPGMNHDSYRPGWRQQKGGSPGSGHGNIRNVTLRRRRHHSGLEQAPREMMLRRLRMSLVQQKVEGASRANGGVARGATRLG